MIPGPRAVAFPLSPPGCLFRHNCPARPPLFTTPGEGLTAAGIPPYFPLALPLSCRPVLPPRTLFIPLALLCFFAVGLSGRTSAFFRRRIFDRLFRHNCPARLPLSPPPCRFPSGQRGSLHWLCSRFCPAVRAPLIPAVAALCRGAATPLLQKKYRLHHPRSPMHLLPALRRVCRPSSVGQLRGGCDPVSCRREIPSAAPAERIKDCFLRKTENFFAKTC